MRSLNVLILRPFVIMVVKQNGMQSQAVTANQKKLQFIIKKIPQMKRQQLVQSLDGKKQEYVTYVVSIILIKMILKMLFQHQVTAILMNILLINQRLVQKKARRANIVKIQAVKKEMMSRKLMLLDMIMLKQQQHLPVLKKELLPKPVVDATMLLQKRFQHLDMISPKTTLQI